MTSDVRQLLRRAAEVDVADLGARTAMQRGLRLRWRRRLILAASVTLALVAVIPLVLPGSEIIGDATDLTPAQRPDNVAPSDGTRDPSARPEPLASVQGIAQERSHTGRERTPDPIVPKENRAALCDPVITDPRFDTTERSIDILRSSITYDGKENALTFTHTMIDIRLDATEQPGEGPFYDLRFDIDGVRYSALSYVTASGAQEFSVVRVSDRPPVGTETAVGQAKPGNATGRIDAVADTARLTLDLDEFNRTESPGLEVGSQLRGIELTANPRGSSWSTQEHETDVGTARCDYVVGRSS